MFYNYIFLIILLILLLLLVGYDLIFADYDVIRSILEVFMLITLIVFWVVTFRKLQAQLKTVKEDKEKDDSALENIKYYLPDE